MSTLRARKLADATSMFNTPELRELGIEIGGWNFVLACYRFGLLQFGLMQIWLMSGEPFQKYLE